METFAFGCLLGSAFTILFSLPVGRGFLVLSLVALAVHLIRDRRKPFFPASGWLCLAFVAWAAGVTLWGANPDADPVKLRKLIWWIGIPVSAALVSCPRRLSLLLTAVAAGAGVLSLWMFIRTPFEAVKIMQSGLAPDFISGVISAGSMADSQRLVVGILATLGVIWVWKKEGRDTRRWAVVLAFQCLAMLITFKRGSWFSVCGAAAVFLAIKTNWRYLLVLGAVIAVALCLPPVQQRLSTIKRELTKDKGGRTTMWTKIAPALIKQYPWGVGFRGVTSEMMRKIAPEVERNRTHLHSNIAEVLVETGWLGFVLYLVWMTLGLIDAAGFTVGSARVSAAEATNGLVLFLMLIGLLANGLIEYNFADAEIVIPYALIMGCAAAGRMRIVSQPAPVPPE